MPDGSDKNLDNIVLILAIIGGDKEFADDFVNIEENQRYAFTPPDADHDPESFWQGGQSSLPPGPLFCLRFSENMFSPTGWVAGSSDSDDCDLRLTRSNMSGISRHHFRIDINPMGRCARITVLSRNSVRIRDDNGKQLELARSQYANIKSPVTVDTGVLDIRVWPPKLTDQGKRLYHEHVKLFRKDLMSAQPVNPASHTAETADVKFALSGAVYKRVGGYSSAGTFGSVFKVMDMTTRTEFAAKVPHYKASDGADVNWKWCALLREEYESLVKLKHAHIVEAFDLVPVREPEPPWLIMEWIPDDLRSLLPLRDDQKTILLGDVSAGLAFMHLNGYAHRDLKPENILIRWDKSMKRNIAKITDVGASKYHATSHMHTSVGPAVYTAPETWETERRYTHTVDLWPLGITALELLVECEFTLEGPSESRFQNWAAESVWPRVELAPTEFSPLLIGLLRNDPGTRWTAAETEMWLTKTLQASTGYAHPHIAAGQTRLISRAAACNNLAARIIATPGIENGAGPSFGLVAFGTIEQLALVAHATLAKWDILADDGEVRI
ncbi:CAMK family protein kinase, partial [Metarhizium majus ARSEF 297]